MATASPVVVLDSGNTPGSRSARRGKPNGRAPGVPLVIPIGRSAVSTQAGDQQGRIGMPAAEGMGEHAMQPQREQQQRLAPAAGGAGLPTQQQPQRNEQQQDHRQAPPSNEEVIIVDSGSESESDSDVIITGVSQRKRPRQIMMQPAQMQQRHRSDVMLTQVTAPVAGPTMPTWHQPPAVAKQRSPSPEPAIKCLICLEGIKTDNMATTPCGHMFCYDCLVDAVKAMKKCPKCRKSVQLKTVKRLYPN